MEGIENNVRVVNIVFLILSALGLKLLGNRIGGKTFGTAIVYAWLVNPITQSNLMWLNNDLVPFSLLLWTLYLITRPAISGFLLGVATQTKYFTAPLFPLYALTFKKLRSALIYILVFVAVNLILVGSIALSNGTEVLDKIYTPYGSMFSWGHSMWNLSQGLADFKTFYLHYIIYPFYISIYLYFYKTGRKDFYILLGLSVTLIVTLLLLASNVNFNYLVWIIGLIVPVILREKEFRL